jgi:hypothetical protein
MKRCFVLKLVEAGDGGREEHFIKEGEVQKHSQCLVC